MNQPPSPMPATPYKGLMPYAEEDAPFFFGREPEREIITANLMAWRLTLLYGPSGVGKSSLLHAGVAHHLRQTAGQNLAETGTPEFAVVVFSAWRDDPLAGLVAGVEEAVAQAIETRFLEETWFLDPNSRSLTQTLQAATERLGGDLLIILDQFEEYFLYHPHEDGAGTFAGEFPRAVNRPDLRVSFLIAIREDALAKLDRFKGRVPNLFDNYLRIEHLDREAARAAIEQPIEQYNRLRATDGRPVSIEPGLVEAVLDQVRTGQVVVGEAGRGVVGVGPAEARIETPYLQLVMTRLWDEEMRAGSDVLRLGTLNRLGGAEQIVERHLDAAMRALPAREQDAAVRIFHHLVTPSGTKIAHTVADLAEYAELPQAQLTQVLEKLSDPAVRILRPVAPPADRPEETRYEIFHDVLAPAILDWRARTAQTQERAEAEERLEQERRRVRRLRWGIVGLMLVLLAVIALAAFASQQRAAAEKARAEALEAYSLSLAANAQHALGVKDTASGLVLALAANRIEQPPAESQRTLMEAAFAPGPRRRFEVADIAAGAVGPALSVAISPDSRTALAGLNDGAIILWELETGEEIYRLTGHTAEVTDVAFSPDGKTALSGSTDTTLILWDVTTGQQIRRFSGHSGAVRAVAISPDARTAIAGGLAGDSLRNPGELILWDLEMGQEIRRFEGNTEAVVDVAISPDGRMVVASSGEVDYSTALGEQEYSLILWDVETGEIIHRFEGIDRDIPGVAISPDSSTALTGSADHNVYLWDLKTGEQVHAFEGHADSVRVVAFSPDGRRAISGGWDGSLILWNLEKRKQLARFNVHTDGVNGAAISPDGRTALSAAAGKLILWDLFNAAEINLFEGHAAPVLDVAFSPDGKTFLSGSGPPDPAAPLIEDNSLRLWDLETGEQIRSLELQTSVVFQVAISPDGRRALSALMEDQSVRLWDLETGREIRRFLGHKAPVINVAFTPDGRGALSSSIDSTLIMWDLESGEIIRHFTGHEGGVWAMAISPDGRTALSGADDRVVIWWDLESGEEIRRFVGHNETVSGVAFSPDGHRAISGETEGPLIEWDLDSGQEIRRFAGHSGTGPVGRTRVAYSPDGRTALSSGWDGTLALWDLETGEELRRFKGHDTDFIFDVAISPDGRTALSGGVDRTIIQWQLATPSLDELFDWVEANRYVRELTCDERELYRIEPLCED